MFLARAGLRVVILEGEKHPRHHIGESLLPASMPILGRLGIGEGELGKRFQRKYGARFYDPVADDLAVFRFDPAGGGDVPAFQVIREEFDLMLVERARAAGCEVREGVTVEDVEEESARVRLSGGEVVEGKFLVDASGRWAMVAKKRRTLAMNPDYGRVAVYNYFAELPPHDAEDEQFITMYLFDGGWVWLIPLRDGRTSVGMVLREKPGGEKPGARSQEPEGTKEERIFWDTAAKMPRLEKRLRAARVTDEYRAIADYSYTVSEKFGERWVAIGDAAGFLDPIFSSGVHLALASAEEASAGVIEKLGTGSSEGLAAYAAYMDQGYHVFSAFVARFYNRDLARNLFFMPNKPATIHAAITRILAGHVWEAENPVLRMLGVRTT
jgi:flavin-dependent dehydrogenase